MLTVATEYTLDRNDIRIRVIRHVLSDKSEAFNVSLTDSDGNSVLLHAVAELEAEELADKLADAINAHTVNKVWR